MHSYTTFLFRGLRCSTLGHSTPKVEQLNNHSVLSRSGQSHRQVTWHLVPAVYMPTCTKPYFRCSAEHTCYTSLRILRQNYNAADWSLLTWRAQSLLHYCATPTSNVNNQASMRLFLHIDVTSKYSQRLQSGDVSFSAEALQNFTCSTFGDVPLSGIYPTIDWNNCAKRHSSCNITGRVAWVRA